MADCGSNAVVFFLGCLLLVNAFLIWYTYRLGERLLGYGDHLGALWKGVHDLQDKMKEKQDENN